MLCFKRTSCWCPACRRMTSSDAARVQASREIAAASVVAASEIYESMEQAVKLVFKTTGSASANFVGHKCAAAQS